MGRTESSKFKTNRIKLLSKVNCCEKCGRRIGLEVHHKIEVINGGTDELNNLMVLCDICHNNEHKATRSELIKKGLAKTKAKGKNIGRAKTTVDEIPNSFKKVYIALLKENKHINITELARFSGVTRPTAYKYIKILEETYSG